MVIKLKKSKDKQHYFIIVSSNGKIIATSETYKRKHSAVKSAIKLINSTLKF